jgi:SAM-dependent methyltransferase
MDARKQLVRDAYDKVAESWGAERALQDDAREKQWLERFFAAVPPFGRVLDLGCGGGQILGQILARGFSAVGVDISQAQLDLAKKACPQGQLIHGDMATMSFAPHSFNGVVGYDSIWHLPHEEYAGLYKQIRRWVTLGGVFLFTAGESPGPAGELLDQQLCGAPIYYAALSLEKTFELLREAGFEVVAFDNQTKGKPLIVLARAV